MTSRAASSGRIAATRHPLVDLTGLADPARMVPLPKTAWIDVDLDAIVANARVLERILPAGCRVQPVVKADAYGHGAVAVARALVESGIETLAVATLDEGLELRQAGIEAPILVLFPIPAHTAVAALRNRLAVTVGDRELAGRTLAALAVLGDVAEDDRLAVHVELETGLGRGGIAPAEAVGLIREVEACPQARLAGLWTHLQAAGNRDITAAQEMRFGEAAGLIEAAGLSLPSRHFSASGGILGATAGAYDAVRIGLSIYGLVPDGLEVPSANRAAAGALRPALSLRARPIRVAHLPAGWGISYGPTFTTTRPSVIATLPLGYADGWPRSLTNKAQVLVRGRRVPQVGTVAMDALMVDVTDVPGPAVTIDDEFTLIGRQGDAEITAREVALWGNTISYEVVSGMSGRLPRVYYAAATPVAQRVIAVEAGQDGERLAAGGDAVRGGERPGAAQSRNTSRVRFQTTN
jgi:alanine racemase